MTLKQLSWGLIFACGAVASSAQAGTATCEHWTLSASWGTAAYAVADASLRHYTSATAYTVVEVSHATRLQVSAGTLTLSGNWQTVPLDGDYRVHWDVTVYSGLNHEPTPGELSSWPANNTVRGSFDTARFTCVAPPQAPPVIFSDYGFYYYEVPAGCSRLDMKLWGAGGGGYPDANRFAFGGGGGFTYASKAVTPGEFMYVLIGYRGSWSGSFGYGGGATTVGTPSPAGGLIVFAQAGGGGSGGNYLGAQGGAGGGDVGGNGGPDSVVNGRGGDNIANRGGLSYDGTYNYPYFDWDQTSNGSHGDGHWKGGYGSFPGGSVPAGSGGGGTGWAQGPGVTISRPGQGTFTGSGYTPAGATDADYAAPAGVGSTGSGLGNSGRVVLRCNN